MAIKSCFGVAALVTLSMASTGSAADKVSGTFVVAGKSVSITHGFANAEKGFFDEAKNDIVVVLCDAAVPVGSTEAMFARMKLVDEGKVRCVENRINTGNQVINYTVRHNAFKMAPSGGSTFNVFEPKSVTPTRIEGRVRTTEPRKSFDDVPYTYDIEFSLAVAPRK